MAYTSRAELERARWLSLRQAIAHIARADACGPASAERQLRAALGDGAIFVRWEDERPIPANANPEGIMIAPDKPPRDGDGWRDEGDGWRHWSWQQACIRGDQVFDPFTRRYRVLLLSRLVVEQIWPERPPTPARSRMNTPRNKVKALLLAHNVDLTKPAKEIFKYVRNHWSGDGCPGDRTIGRAVKEVREAKTQG